MTTPSKTAKSDLTVLVFKDNSTARTFRVPGSWLSRLGLLVGAICAVACLGVFLSVKYYVAARQAIRIADPGYVQDLEAEVASLRAAGQPAAQPPVKAQTTSLEAKPVPTVTVTVTPPASESTSVGTLVAPAVGFAALPGSVTTLPASEVPITIHEPHVSWYGRTLRVQFFIQYSRDDRGNQQGRIVLVARGPDTVLAYPTGVLNTGEDQSLIAPEKGEYFSVSRIREVKADFGPMKSRSALKKIEVFLFSTEGKLLVHQFLAPTEPAAVTEPAARPEPAAATAPDAPSEPASDQPANSTPDDNSGSTDQ